MKKLRKEQTTKVNNTNKYMKNNKKKFHGLRIVISLILIFIILGYLISAIVKLVKNPSNTVVVREGTISQEEMDIGYIIRDETIVKGENFKNGMEQIVDEGQKVSKGESIFRYYSEGEDSLKEKIKVLDLKIQETIENSSDDLPLNDTKLLDTQISQKLSTINQLNSIQTIQETKKAINNYITKKAKITGELSPSGSYLKKLIDEKNGYENKLNDGSEYISAPVSGMVSYRIDGLEETLTTKDFSKYNKEFLSNLNTKAGQIISTSTEQGKIINNFISYIVCTSKSKNANAAEIGDKVKLTLPSGKNVNATIEYIIKEENDETTMVFSITEGIEELAYYRKISFDIIWWNSTGYKVPNSAIITENNLNYVIRTKAGYLDRILVKVKKKSDLYSIVGNYSTSEIKDLSIDSKISTSILLYDELILKPTENQIKSTE